MSKDFEERTDRVCDALVLGYNPNNSLGRDYRGDFYIPGQFSVEEAFGFALGEIFGIQERFRNWGSWRVVPNDINLEKRILNGVSEVITGDPDYQTIFGMYINSDFRFDNTWIYLKGTLHKFREGKREAALTEFETYWNKQEKARWEQIHKFMREYSKREFKRKGN